MKGKRAVLMIASVFVFLLFVPGKSPGQGKEEQAPASEGVTSGVVFPYTLPESGLVIEQLVPYSGTYYEDGKESAVTDAAGLVIRNAGQKMVRFGAVVLEQDGKRLYFFVYCLPPGARCLVAEKCRQAYSLADVTACRMLKTQWTRQERVEEQVGFAGFGEKLTAVNRSAVMCDIALWYKHYDPEKGYYLGGVAYCARFLGMEPGEQRSVHPEYYDAADSKVVLIE